MDIQLGNDGKKIVEGVPNCSFINLEPIRESRGELCFTEGNNKEIPFPIQRIFWIYNVPKGKNRGGHANWKCTEAIFALSGSFDIYVDDGFTYQTYTINTPNKGILIPAGVWCLLQNFRPGTVCFVAASTKYDNKYYVNNYQKFLEKIRCK